MTEFTSEFIDQQKQLAKKISPLPWTACSCGKCGSISNETDAIAKVTMGNWGDDYPDIRRIGGSIEGKFETFMNQITYGNIPKETGNINAQYIANACNNYPEALDHIERLQQRIAELEQDLSDQSQKRLENAHVSADRIIALEGKIRELEQERRWIPVSKRLPKALQEKYVICQREDGKRYTGLAQYVPYREVLEVDFVNEGYWGNFDCSDYDGENDKWYAREGWYEFSIESELAYRLSDPVIAWSNVPQPPKEGE